MRDALGDGYAEALRGVYDDVPETVDYVMYWWDKAARLVRRGDIRRFGLITTNSITQTLSRKVLQHHMDASTPLSHVFAIPDQPWVDSESGAAVRIAMTAAAAGSLEGTLMTVSDEREGRDDVPVVSFSSKSGRIHPDLSTGADLPSAVRGRLQANAGLSFMGVTLIGDGFILTAQEKENLSAGHHDERPALRFFVNGRDLMGRSRNAWAIDLFGLLEEEARARFPASFARLVERVLPVRRQNPRQAYRDSWWIFGEPRPAMREALSGIDRYIATCRTA